MTSNFEAYLEEVLNSDLQEVSTSQGDLFYLVDLDSAFDVIEVYVSDKQDKDYLFPLSDSRISEEEPMYAQEVFNSVVALVKAELEREEQDAKDADFDRRTAIAERGFC